MKKKILIIVALIIVLCIGIFVLTGCGNNESEDKTESNMFSNKKDEILIGNETLKFNKETTFKNFKFMNVDGIKPDESKQAVYLTYENKEIYDGRFVFRISLQYSDETNLKEFLQDNKTTKKNINGIEWNTLSVENTTDKKETKSIIYATQKDGVLYAVSILCFKEANIDITNLAEVFMNGVTIK